MTTKLYLEIEGPGDFISGVSVHDVIAELANKDGIFSARIIDPPAAQCNEPEDAYLYAGREGYVVSAGLTAEQARQVSGHMNHLYNEVVKLRKPAPIADSEPVAYVELDSWLAGGFPENCFSRTYDEYSIPLYATPQPTAATEPAPIADSEPVDWASMPGYPYLPCPICKGVEGCDDCVPDRARAYYARAQPVAKVEPMADEERLSPRMLGAINRVNMAAMQAIADGSDARFFIDHGLWHDRVTGQHLYTQDQYDEGQKDAVDLERLKQKEALMFGDSAQPLPAPTQQEGLHAKLMREVFIDLLRVVEGSKGFTEKALIASAKAILASAPTQAERSE